MTTDSVTIEQAIREYNDVELLQYLQEIENEENNKKVMQDCRFMRTEGFSLLPPQNCTSLMLALCRRKSVDVILKLIKIGGEELVMKNISDIGTALHVACNEYVSLDIVSKLIEIGGRELLMMSVERGRTALHNACRKKSMSLNIVSKMIEVGGRELLLTSSKHGGTALNIACRFASIDIILKLIEVGGKELIMKSVSKDGHTALHDACFGRNRSIDIVSKLIEVGGKELVMYSFNKFHHTALHYACGGRNPSIDIVSKLIEVVSAGRELVMTSDRKGRTALHYVCMSENVSHDIISKLIAVGGRELLMCEDANGDNALHYGYFYCHSCHSHNGSFTLMIKEFLIKEYIMANIGGEFGIGGLFHVARQEVQGIIYEKWQEEISPALESVIESLQGYQPPILHAAIIAKAPSHVICDIIDRFEYSILKVDSLNRFPIEVAFQESLAWHDGSEQIVEATAIAQQQHTSVIQLTAQYGLKWKCQMKELAEANGDEVMNRYDSSTGLRLFMIAAMGNNNDLSSVYGMMKMGPEAINML